MLAASPYGVAYSLPHGFFTLQLGSSQANVGDLRS